MPYNFDEVIDRKNTDCIKYDAIDKYFGADDILPMWVADMDFKVPDFILTALQERVSHGIFGYSYRSDKYNNSIVSWMERKHNWKIRPEWLAYSPGVVPAINLCIMAFTNPGDKIIIQPPVYYPFISSVRSNNRSLVYNQLAYKQGKYYIDFDDLEKKAGNDTKMLIFCSPHNPVGRVWNKDELLKLAHFCLEKEILLISDEIHADLVFKQYQHIPVASLSEEISQNTITCIAASKTFNLAALATSSLIIGNKDLLGTYNNMLDKVHVGMGNVFGHVAAEAAYNQGIEWVEKLMEYVHGNLEYLKQFIHENIPEIKVIEPEGTYLVWLDCKNLKMGPVKLKKFFIEEARLGLNNGTMFGPGGEGFQRINIACPRSVLEMGVKNLRNAVGKLR